MGKRARVPRRQMQDDRNNSIRVRPLKSDGCLSSFDNLSRFEQATVFDPTVAMACA